MVTLKFYGDESADETKSRVFAVAAVLGSESEWQATMKDWLRRTRGLPFHANKCESEYVNHPDPQKHKDNLNLYKDLTQILAKSWLVGVAVALDLRSLREFLPEIDPDIGYYKCFSDLIGLTGDRSRRFNNDSKNPTKIRTEYVFDSRLESDGTAGTIYTVFRTLPEWKDSTIFDTKITFERGQEPRLEMGDLLAREAMKELDRKVTGAARPPRRSYEALCAEMGGRKFRFIERDRAYCERWRDTVNAAESQAQIPGYIKWLVDTGRHQHGRVKDNITNRTLYYAYLEHKEFNAQRGASDGA